MLRLAVATLLAAGGALLVVLGLVTLLRAAGVGSGTTPGATDPPVAAATAPASPAPSGAPADTPAPSATTPGSPTPLPAEVVLVGAGDIGRCDRTTDEDTAALIAGRPGIVFTLGDNAYDHGSAEDFRDCFGSSWGRVKDRIELPVPGNHEYETRDAAGYKDYFGERAVRDGATWYSVDIGAWHVVVLDSTCNRVPGGCDADSPQVTWLRDDLASSDARCTLALFHHPRFSSGDHGSDDHVAPFWDVLYAAGADLVLNGHDHDYERFAPQDPAGNADDERGIMQLIVGTGGAELREFKDPVANSRVRSSLAYGVIELGLHQNGWRWQFYPTDQSFIDAGSGTCH
jgi:acid phosphatase type 7